MLRTRPWVLAGGLALFLANTIHGQEGRPALPAETAEDARVKRVLNESLPNDLPKWTIESESRLDGVGSFHDPTEAVTTPFHHEITISYAYHPTEQERAALQADATTTAGIRRVMASTQCEVRAAANDFDDQMHDEAPIRVISRPPFSLALVGDVETRVYLGPWAPGAPERDGDAMEYRPMATRNRTAPGSQIQTVSIRLACAPQAAELILAKSNVTRLATMIGESVMPMPTRHPLPTEKALTPAPIGDTAIAFTIDGGDLHQRNVRLKPSKQEQFAYLNNLYPDFAVTDNAMTRLLASEDADFATKNKSGFLDITMPLVRTTGTFEVTPDADKATLAGGINCWDACEWSFDAKAVTVTVTRYDPVNGFIEGTFSGSVMLKYKASEPIDHRETTAMVTGGVFKVRRRADR